MVDVFVRGGTLACTTPIVHSGGGVVPPDPFWGSILSTFPRHTNPSRTIAATMPFATNRPSLKPGKFWVWSELSMVRTEHVS
jgi:hypothetical protein